MKTKSLIIVGCALAFLTYAPTALTQQVDPSTKICTVRLHGRVGGYPTKSPRELHHVFDAELIEKCFRRALQQKASVVILDIETPGGRVDVMQDICRKLVEYHDKLRVVAWVGDAGSAGSVITLTCREIVVKPITRIGAALSWRFDADGNRVSLDEERRKDPLAQKKASFNEALVREFMAASGHPIELVEAMTTQTAELWWSPSQQRFSSRRPSDFQISNDWQQLDDRQTVMTLTGDEAVQFGVAIGMAQAVDEIPNLLDISGPVEVVDLSHIVRRYNADVIRRIAAFHKNAKRLRRALHAIEREMQLMPDVDWDIPPNERAEATVGVKRRLGKISDNVAQCRSALGALRRIDRLLIKRRIQTPDQPDILARIDLDAEAIVEVRKMLRQYMKHNPGSDESWDQAEAWVNSSCKMWSQIRIN